MEQQNLFPVPTAWKEQAHVTAERYKDWYQQSINNPDAFWAERAKDFTWYAPWKRLKQSQFESPVSIRWFEGAKTNMSANCLDRHLPQHAGRTAIIWEGDNPSESKHITYGELHADVCRFANVLKAQGIKKGDRVTIYLPMIPEAAVSMLACARIGAIHSVVFGGFSAEALRGRIEDCQSKLVITADESLRGGKAVPLKANADKAVEGLSYVQQMIVVRRTGAKVAWAANNSWYHEVMATASADCTPEQVDAEDPLFILYTSGSTGKPKGVLHTTAGYMVWTSFTHRMVFDYKPADIFWCTADVGWITGHSYVVYGPLLNGATTLMFEGVPNYPDSSRFWQVVDKHQVTIFHTAPTAIRALMRDGDAFVQKASRKSLRLIGSVGEPINPEAWLWYWRVVGEGRCPIVDTWWQTETGGNMITPFPGATDLKPGSASWPFFGVQPLILDPTSGKTLEGACEGVLCIKDSWPGQARTVYGDHARFEQTYFSQYKGLYFTGDGAKRDADGYYWITGRVDDVLNVSGHRIGTAEVENALVGHDHVTEAAVVGYPHDIKGQGIYCYVTLAVGVAASAEIEKDLKQWVRKEIGPIATPDILHFTPALPKTRSGKIMRRILRKIAEGDTSNLGDISTLTNPEIVEELKQGRKS
ncbi:MAG: acetate--CoA ligase [Rickettsiales bacterium]|nr:acetate--CoA ligase [Rickettsiales bacterium]